MSQAVANEIRRVLLEHQFGRNTEIFQNGTEGSSLRTTCFTWPCGTVLLTTGWRRTAKMVPCTSRNLWTVDALLQTVKKILQFKWKWQHPNPSHRWSWTHVLHVSCEEGFRQHSPDWSFWLAEHLAVKTGRLCSALRQKRTAELERRPGALISSLCLHYLPTDQQPSKLQHPPPLCSLFLKVFLKAHTKKSDTLQKEKKGSPWHFIQTGCSAMNCNLWSALVCTCSWFTSAPNCSVICFVLLLFSQHSAWWTPRSFLGKARWRHCKLLQTSHHRSSWLYRWLLLPWRTTRPPCPWYSHRWPQLEERFG